MSWILFQGGNFILLNIDRVGLHWAHNLLAKVIYYFENEHTLQVIRIYCFEIAWIEHEDYHPSWLNGALNLTLLWHHSGGTKADWNCRPVNCDVGVISIFITYIHFLNFCFCRTQVYSGSLSKSKKLSALRNFVDISLWISPSVLDAW